MNKKTVLILGNGFIGKNLYRYFANRYDATITNQKEINITDNRSVKNYLYNKSFDYIIYAIGLKNVNTCETYPQLAYDINANGIKYILSCLNSSTKFIYISTDYVFDGISGYYTEEDACNPCTVYGKSKVLGESYSLQHPNTIVVRTSGVYGIGCAWLDSLIQQLSNNQQVVCFSDVYNSPTYAINLAEMIEDILKIDFTGTIHLSGETKSNRYDLYRSVATIFSKNQDLLIRGTDSDQIFPKNISLNNKLYNSLTNKKSNTILYGLTRLFNEY